MNNKKGVFSLLCITAILLIFSFISYVNAEAQGYTVYGYVNCCNSTSNSSIMTGTKVEITGTGLFSLSDENGFFSISGIPANSNGYVINFSKAGYLSRSTQNILINSDLQIETPNTALYLWPGDFNSDNSINMSDIILMAKVFNAVKGDVKYNADFDLNKDDVVNMTDLVLIAANFNKVSSEYPTVKLSCVTSKPSYTSTNTSTSTSTPTSIKSPTPTILNIIPSVTKTEDSLMTYSGLTTVSYGGYLNGESFQQDGIVSYNGYQYSAFWNTNKHVVMCRRKLPTGEWAKFEFTDYPLSAQDAHNTISIGICPQDGTMHLAFDHHGNDLHYRVSTAGLVTSPEKFTWNASNFGTVTSNLVGNNKISLVTYPRFITEPSNKLLFEYRYGESGSGDQYLLEYDGSTKKWISLGKYIDGISQNNNAYAHGITYDKNGRLHETWCWRETPDATTNHDLMYIYSDDNGRTWKNNAGTTVAVTGSSSVNKNTSGVKVWTINQNRGLINQEAQMVDNNGNIHVLLSHLPDSVSDNSNFTNARKSTVYFHYWRDSSGTWHRTNTGFPSVLNFRGKLAFSKSNNIYAILPNLRIAAASASSNWSDWKMVNTEYQDKFFSDPLVDYGRLKAEENTLTLFCPKPSSPNIYNLTFTLN
ncbi:BNR-4 repeat-containing protein [Pseudobacteroides cellulosolvens]|uniref:Dockerin domain-containing protein n=1 Tax=Pseudobacteroides cellulosolvens ATCC 35603 = DSM 2933 TaxID=398512 RepID=A0A0L6JKM7_9FIRM|nr:BNR-4 repeat-containing protein [Pseudobacteroides cellulosolvens]KNY25932.1 hypothetical protein Bccel_1192 [Pseudobacteroides cellulosolvens ATCC 35603 = DSM 2933]